MAARKHESVTSIPWAVKLPEDAVPYLGQIRLWPDMTACLYDGALWLQGSVLDDRLATVLRSLPGAVRYRVVDGGLLTGWDETVPAAKLPVADWQPLTKMIGIKLPEMRFAAKSQESVPLRLVRSEAIEEANMLRTDWTTWYGYSTTAPHIRLMRLSFAVSERDEVLVRGTPLPPVPGQRYVEVSGIAIPSGYAPEPPIDADLLRIVLRVPENHLAILGVDDQIEIIDEMDFVHASRSAVRKTDELLASRSRLD